jgi:hypothetical protein
MNRHPPDAYRQLFLQGKRNRGGPLCPGENGDHYRTAPHFFEWWYFDVAFPDGGWLVAVLNSAAHHVGDHRPNVDLRYYPPGGSPVVATGRFSRQGYEANHTRFRIRVGESWATEEDGGYHLQLCQGPLVADLTFYSQLPGWRVGTGHLFADPPSGQYFDWVIPVPRARVEGTLTVRGKSRKVAGVGYHDQGVRQCSRTPFLSSPLPIPGLLNLVFGLLSPVFARCTAEFELGALDTEK